jgi:hypothetical protein
MDVLDQDTVAKIDREIEAAEEAKKEAARKVRRLRRLKESAQELAEVVGS